MFCRFGLRAGQPAGRGHRLVERRVQPSILAQQLRQRVEVGALELGEFAVGDDLLGDWMRGGECGEHRRVGREAGLRALLRRQAELVEEHLGKLLGRVDQELAAGELVDLGAQGVDAAFRIRREPREHVAVDADTHALHAREHGHERHLDVAQDLKRAVGGQTLLELGREAAPSPPRESPRTSSSLGRLGHRCAEVVGNERRQLVGRAIRLEQIRRDVHVEKPLGRDRQGRIVAGQRLVRRARLLQQRLGVGRRQLARRPEATPAPRRPRRRRRAPRRDPLATATSRPSPKSASSAPSSTTTPSHPSGSATHWRTSGSAPSPAVSRWTAR